jgi:hypothetical protein
MQKEEFINYLSKPAKLDEKSLSNLRELLVDYPYFQAAHLLLVKNLSNLNHLKFDSQLRLSAAYVGNRKLLFRLLSTDAGSSEPKVIHPVSEVPKELVPAEQPKSAPVKIVADESPGEKSIADIVLKQVADMKQSLDRPATEKKETKLAPTERKSAEEFFEIDDKQEITSGEVPADQIQETKSKPDLLVIDEQDKPDHADQPGKKVKKISGKKISEKSTQKKTPLEKEIDLHESHSFTSWLSLFWEEEGGHSGGNDGGSGKKNELIDAFITNPPRMERPAMITSDEEVEDISRYSVMESDDFITETLARIYVKQKKYDKAISFYEKLSLKYPEKVSYFADQIEEIRKLITS